MSVTIIVILMAVVAALVGVKVYLEYREEKKLEETKKDDVFEDLNTYIVNPVKNEIVVVEEKEEIKVVENPVDFKTTDPEPAVEVEKKKPKKRYYGKKVKKDNKKISNKNKKSQQ